MSEYSLLKGVFAPAPRYMMRLALAEKLFEGLPDSIATFLEIGPGTGDLSLYLCQRFPFAAGDLYEISEESVSLLKTRVQATTALSIHHADFLELNVYERYDLAIACEVFEHLEDDEPAFRKIQYLLKERGFFIFSAPAKMKRWGPADEYGGHVRRYERDELIKKFEIEGFTILHLWTYGFPLTNLISPFTRMYYQVMNASKKLSRMESTKRSGSERRVARFLHRLPVAALMRPFFYFQDRAKKTDRGDGYIVLAKK